MSTAFQKRYNVDEMRAFLEAARPLMIWAIEELKAPPLVGCLHSFEHFFKTDLARAKRTGHRQFDNLRRIVGRMVGRVLNSSGYESKEEVSLDDWGEWRFFSNASLFQRRRA